MADNQSHGIDGMSKYLRGSPRSYSRDQNLDTVVESIVQRVCYCLWRQLGHVIRNQGLHVVRHHKAHSIKSHASDW